MQINDIVAIEMTYAEQESYTDENGYYAVRTVGTRTETVVDRITAIYDNGSMFGARCHHVQADQVSPATDEQRAELLKIEADCAQMLANGDRLMSALVEPEYL